MTHSPSFETSTSCAEIPPKYGTNCPDFDSNRTNSPRGCSPITKSLLPSTLETGDRKSIGPAVNCTGSPFPFRKRRVLSRSAQMSVLQLKVD